MTTRSTALLLIGIAGGFGAGFLVRGFTPGENGTPGGTLAEFDNGEGQSTWDGYAADGAGSSEPQSGGGTSKGKGVVTASGLPPAPDKDADDEILIAYAGRLAWQKSPAEAIAWAKKTGIDEGDIDEVMGEIAKVWSGSDPEKAFRWAIELPSANEKFDAIAGVIEGVIEKGDLNHAIKFLERLPPGYYRDRALVSAMEELAKSDVNQALKLMDSASEGYGLHKAARVLAKSYLEIGEAEDLKRMIDAMPYGRVQQRIGAALLEELVQTDKELAVAWLNQESDAIPSDAARLVAYRLVHEIKREDRADALAWAEKIPEGSARESFFRTLGNAWARDQPDVAGEWLIASINDQSYDDYRQLSEGLIAEWVEYDHEKPFEMIEQIQNPDARRSAAMIAIHELSGENPGLAGKHLSDLIASESPEVERLTGTVVSRWLNRDPEQATIWLNDQAAGPAKDRAIDVLVDYLLDEDHDFAAAQAWIGEVQSEKKREYLTKTFERAVTRWQASESP